MKRWSILLLALALAACTAPIRPKSVNPGLAQAAPAKVQSAATVDAPAREIPGPKETPVKADYPDLGAAPELAGDVWLNSDRPLRLADLRGKVVLVDMWTFG